MKDPGENLREADQRDGKHQQNAVWLYAWQRNDRCNLHPKATARDAWQITRLSTASFTWNRNLTESQEKSCDSR